MHAKFQFNWFCVTGLKFHSVARFDPKTHTGQVELKEENVFSKEKFFKNAFKGKKITLNTLKRLHLQKYKEQAIKSEMKRNLKYVC